MSSKVLFAACALAALALPAAAQEGAAVVRDADTGKLRAPTAAELRAMHSRSLPQPQQQARPATSARLRADGSRSAELGERGMVYSTATRAADGSVTQQCADGHAIAAAPAPAVDAKETHHER